MSLLNVEICTLVRLAREGDREAFTVLIERHQAMVLAVIEKRVRNRACAREVLQEVCLMVHRKLAQLRDEALFEHWIKRIAIRLSINKLVRRPRERLGEQLALDHALSVTRQPLESLLASERVSIVQDGLAKLGEIDRSTLVAFYLEGRSLQQMSCDFSTPVGT
ncbi:MAG: RNA polymerase sigma factor, partial [Planctomycetaceae bacterium]